MTSIIALLRTMLYIYTSSTYTDSLSKQSLCQAVEKHYIYSQKSNCGALFGLPKQVDGQQSI